MALQLTLHNLEAAAAVIIDDVDIMTEKRELSVFYYCPPYSCKRLQVSCTHLQNYILGTALTVTLK